MQLRVKNCVNNARRIQLLVNNIYKTELNSVVVFNVRKTTLWIFKICLRTCDLKKKVFELALMSF